jgi:hypothetical protein
MDIVIAFVGVILVIVSFYFNYYIIYVLFAHSLKSAVGLLVYQRYVH